MTNEEKLEQIIVDEFETEGINPPFSPMFMRILREAFNLGLEVAAEEGEVLWVENPKLSDPNHITAIVDKESILKHKL